MKLNINNLTQEQVEAIKTQIVEFEAKNSKPTPEQRFAELIQGLEIKTDLENYPDSIFYFRGNEYWAEYDSKNNYFWLSYSKMWSVFEKKYGLNYEQVKELIGKKVEEHFKRKGVTTYNKLN